MRRGAERFINELASYLGRIGNDVTVLSAHPAATSEFRRNNYLTRIERSLWHPVFDRYGLGESKLFYFNALRNFSTTRYDIIHACGHADAFAAVSTRWFSRTPCIFWVNGAVPDGARDRGLFAQAIRRADATVVLSDYVRRMVRDRFGRNAAVIPVPVDIDRFQPRAQRHESPPTIFCAATLDVPRKGGAILFKAFNQLKKSGSPAVLKVSGALQESTAKQFTEFVAPEFRDEVIFLGVGNVDDVPRQFAEASVSVLPSVREAFGLVVIESLACGVPVVGTRDGAIPEIVTDGETGVLFDRSSDLSADSRAVANLEKALVRGLELAADPSTAKRCRQQAEAYSWTKIGPRFEALYRQLIERSRHVQDATSG